MFKETIKRIFDKLVFEANTPHKLALSFAIGIFIAFSPFIGFHNLMILLFSIVFKLNAPVVFVSAHVNNPLTTIPIFSFNYLFGKWFMGDFCKIHPVNPDWVNYLNDYLTTHIGIPKLCFWSFIIGSNILGLIFGLISYPIMRFVFTKINYKDMNFRNFKNLFKRK